MQVTASRQAGASLIEVLVSMLVLSLGLLGMVGMVTTSFKREQISATRALVADSLANMADRIRANNDRNLPPDTYAYSNDYESERSSIDSNADFLKPAVDCLTTACTPAQMAAFDVAEWRAYVDRQLPGAVGHIETVGARGMDLRYTLTVAWADASKSDETSDETNARTCSEAGNASLIKARSCCPADLSHPAGVVCSRMEVIP